MITPHTNAAATVERDFYTSLDVIIFKWTIFILTRLQISHRKNNLHSSPIKPFIYILVIIFKTSTFIKLYMKLTLIE